MKICCRDRVQKERNKMQRLSAIVLFLLITASASAQQDTIATSIETPAEFPGGMDSLSAYFKRNFIYPQLAKELGIQGKCVLSFTITAEGNMTNIKVLRGVADCPECDREAIRLFRNMPAWIPATRNGVPIESHYQMPTLFTMY